MLTKHIKKIIKDCIGFIRHCQNILNGKYPDANTIPIINVKRLNLNYKFCC